MDIPLVYKLIGHCLFVATLAPDLKDRFLLHYWITFFAGFGGGVVTSLLLMAPEKAGIALFADNMVGLVWTSCWWLVNYFPGGSIGRVVNVWYIKIITKMMCQMMRVSLIITRVNQANAFHPGVLAAALVLGTLAGSGGKFIVDAVRQGYGLLALPAETTIPGYSFQSALLGASLYYFLGFYFNLLTPNQAGGLILFLLITHAGLTELTGRPLDIFRPVFRVLHSLTNIPEPGAPTAAPQGKPAVLQMNGYVAPPHTTKKEVDRHPTPSKKRSAKSKEN